MSNAMRIRCEEIIHVCKECRSAHCASSASASDSALLARNVVNLPEDQLPEMQLQLPRKPFKGKEEEGRSKVCLVRHSFSCWSSILSLNYIVSGYAFRKPLRATYLGILIFPFEQEGQGFPIRPCRPPLLHMPVIYVS